MHKWYQGVVVALAVVLAVPAFAADIKTPNLHDAPFNNGRVAFVCDDDVLENAYFENELTAYGNAFDVGAGGPLSVVGFWHYGWFTQVGPYDYNLKVYDEATCTEIASIPLEAADAFDHDEFEEEDLCAYGVNVSGQIVVAVEPLSCAGPTDCYPDVYFERIAPINACSRIVDVATGAGCDVANQDDFLLRITVDECGGTPTEDNTWGGVKNLYR